MPIPNMGNKTTVIGLEQSGLGVRVGQAFLKAYDWLKKSKSIKKNQDSSSDEEREWNGKWI